MKEIMVGASALIFTLGFISLGIIFPVVGVIMLVAACLTVGIVVSYAIGDLIIDMWNDYHG